MMDILTSDIVLFLLAIAGGVYAIAYFIELDIEADRYDREAGRSAKYGNRRPDKGRR